MKKNHNKLRTLASAFVFTILGTVLTAQPGGQQGPPQVPNEKQISKIVDDLAKEIELSEAQEAQVSAIYINHFKNVKAKVSGNQRPSPQDMDALDSKLEEEVKAKLNADQKKLYSKWLKKQTKKRASNGPPQGQRPPR